jgi:hypothetical protein
MLVDRRDTGARVDDQEHQIGIADGDLGLTAHAGRQAVVESILQPRGIDRAKLYISNTRVALTAVAGHPGLVVDDSVAPAHQAIE